MRPAAPKLEPYIVTVQYSFRVDAPSQLMAERIASTAISFNTLLATALLAHGVQAQPFTKEAVEAMGFNMEDIQSDRSNRQ